MPNIRIIIFSGAMLFSSAWGQTVGDRAQQLGPTLLCGSDYQSGTGTVCKPKEPSSAPVAAAKPAVSPPPASATPKPTVPATTATTAVIGGVSDKDIDDHLATWGKPSREAVRAALNPTDENITAMRRKNQADLAMSAYIANRASQIDATSSAIKVESLGGAEAPALNRMKVILYSTLKCASCDRMFTALQTLAVQAPMLDASVAVTSAASEKEIIVELARLGLTLPVRQAQSNELSRLGKSPPFLHIVDAKNQTEGTIPASSSTDEIKSAIIGYRKSNDDRSTKKEKAK